MFNTTKKLIKDILTENDNSTFCLARVSAVIAIIGFIAGTGYDVYVHHIFAYSSFSTGFMQLLGGGGAMIGMKQFSSKS